MDNLKCEKCGKEFKGNKGFKQHIESCLVNNCLECGKPINRNKKFCNLVCAGSYNGRIYNNISKNCTIYENNNICIDCGKEEIKERHRCEECFKKYNRDKTKKSYHKNKLSKYTLICPVCKLPMSKRNTFVHQECKKNIHPTENYNKYINKSINKTYGRDFIQSLGIKIPDKCHIHHIDENPMNNVPENLIICSNKVHPMIHHRILQARSEILKNNTHEECEELIKDIRLELTKLWIEECKSEIITIEDALLNIKAESLQ